MKYLVTGGCGFIGSHLVDALHSQGHYVRVLDDLSTGSLRYTPPAVSFVKGDIADPKIVEIAMRDIDAVFHLAAVASVERCNDDWAGTHQTNLTGTITILDQARANGGVPVVFASSAAVYGDNPALPLTEDALARPVSAYGADKFGCELHGLVASHVHKVPNCGLRFFNVYGPRQDPKSPYSGVITIFGNRIKAGHPITINGDGFHSRDFIYVGDVVNALMRAMDFCRDQRGHHVFNVCTGIETNVIDLAEEMMILLEPVAVRHGPARPGDPRASIGDPTKARRLLGFEAAVPIHTGLATTFAVPTARGLAA